MGTVVGQIEAIFCYPVKSMRGRRVESATLGWHGLEGDRRFAFRRADDRSGFPWVTAGKVPRLILFTPDGDENGAPTEVVSPTGERMPLFGAALGAEIARVSNGPVEMMQLRQGIFDDASVSVITSDTVREIGRVAGMPPDIRRFRPNIVIRSESSVPFEEDGWIGGRLTFGDDESPPAVAATMRDLRCAMINIDPDDGSIAPDMLKAVVRGNQNGAGVYATVTRTGILAIGQPVVLHR